MPDADDFDVEYFRNLLKGSRPKDGHAPPAAADFGAKQKMRQAPKPPAAKEKGKPPAGRKKRENR